MNKMRTISLDRLLCATRNRGKEMEIRQLLANLTAGVVSLSAFPWLPECEEGGVSFAENACRKAAFYSRITGLLTLGDDSGLEVDALGGAPGIHSARYAGPGASDNQRIEKLLAELAGRAPAARTARFVCAVSLVADGRELIATRGICEGLIIDTPRGTGGFGYDPVFLVPELNKTFAELEPAEKHRFSHRGRALAAFREEFAKLTAARGCGTMATGCS